MNDPSIFEALKNVAKLKDVLRDAEGMREQVEKMNEELTARTVEGDAGAGAGGLSRPQPGSLELDQSKHILEQNHEKEYARDATEQ